MDTSEFTRRVVLWLLFGSGCAVVIGNVFIVANLAARRKVGRAAMVIWPGLLAVCVLCLVDAFVWEPNRVQLTRHEISTSKMPRGCSLKIVHLTDFHLVGKLGPAELAAIRMIRVERPDVIVLTGDYTAIKTPEALRALKQMAERLSRLAPVYAVEGNWDTNEDFAALCKGGATILESWLRIRCRNGGSVALGRAEWYRGGVERPPRDLSRLYRIVLCHSPAHFETLAAKAADLILAGHTHGGQVRLPMFGALLPERSLVGKYQQGFYRLGKSVMYVNRGLGTERAGAPKVRFLCRPEVAVFEITGG